MSEFEIRSRSLSSKQLKEKSDTDPVSPSITLLCSLPNSIAVVIASFPSDLTPDMSTPSFSKKYLSRCNPSLSVLQIKCDLTPSRARARAVFAALPPWWILCFTPGRFPPPCKYIFFILSIDSSNSSKYKK